MNIADPRIDPALVPKGSVARIINGPKNEWQDLPAVRTPNGYIITRWTPTPEERLAIENGHDIYVTLISNGIINPMFVTVGPVNWNEDPT
jgi:hypothetical protein